MRYGDEFRDLFQNFCLNSSVWIPMRNQGWMVQGWLILKFVQSIHSFFMPFLSWLFLDHSISFLSFSLSISVSFSLPLSLCLYLLSIFFLSLSLSIHGTLTYYLTLDQQIFTIFPRWFIRKIFLFNNNRFVEREFEECIFSRDRKWSHLGNLTRTWIPFARIFRTIFCVPFSNHTSCNEWWNLVTIQKTVHRNK